MSMVNQFLPFATGVGANTISQAAYSAHSMRGVGHQPGVALAELENTVLRQLSTAIAGLAQLAADYGTEDMLDDGTPANFATGFLSALQKIIELNAWEPGDIKTTAISTVPAGWLECNGAAVSRATYADLFTAVGVTYGAGDGSTTFNLPDYRGEFLRGWDHGRGVDSGRLLGSAQADMLKSHTHDMGSESGGSSNIATPVDSSNVDETAGGNPTAATGGAETRPRNISVMFLIKI